MNKESNISNNSLISILRLLGKDDLYYFFLSACRVGDLNACQICLDAGAGINIRDNLYKTNLLIGLIEKDTSENQVQMEVYEWLIKKGASINYFEAAHTPLNVAVSTKRFELVKLLIDKGAEVLNYGDKRLSFDSDILMAIKPGNYDVVKLLLDNGATINRDDYTSTPLLKAVQVSDYSIVKLLLEYGADVNKHFSTYSRIGDDPVKSAVISGNMEILELLIQYGADINKRYDGNQIIYNKHEDKVAITYMDMAIYEENKEMQEFLAKHGCKASTTEEKRKAILYIGEDSTSVRLLKKYIL